MGPSGVGDLSLSGTHCFRCVDWSRDVIKKLGFLKPCWWQPSRTVGCFVVLMLVISQKSKITGFHGCFFTRGKFDAFKLVCIEILLLVVESNLGFRFFSRASVNLK